MGEPPVILCLGRMLWLGDRSLRKHHRRLCAQGGWEHCACRTGLDRPWREAMTRLPYPENLGPGKVVHRDARPMTAMAFRRSLGVGGDDHGCRS